jgi:hypothetical protein
VTDEERWPACTDPLWALASLRVRGRASERKLLVFAVACCRRIPHDPDTLRALGVAERLADGLAGAGECAAAEAGAREAAGRALELWEPEESRSWRRPSKCRAREIGEPDLPSRIVARLVSGEVNDAFRLAEVTAIDTAVVAGARAYDAATSLSPREAGRARAIAMTHEKAAQCRLLRDIFGNPFRPAAVDPGWLTPAVITMATAIYGERRFQDLPVLADALEDAGCNGTDLLAHCRGGGEHAPGCWAVDALLGKA